MTPYPDKLSLAIVAAALAVASGMHYGMSRSLDQGRLAGSHSAPYPITRPASEAPRRAHGPGEQQLGSERIAMLTKPGDTLYSLVQNLALEGVSPARLASAVMHANPHAFVEGDPAKLKIGQMIAWPTRDEALAEEISAGALAIFGPADLSARHDERVSDASFISRNLSDPAPFLPPLEHR